MEATLRAYASDAIRYWEPRRLIYNVVLAVIVLAHFWITLPASMAALRLDDILFLFVLAVLANVAYCAAYVVDIFIQAAGFSEMWRSYRWMLFVVGMAFAAVLTRFFSMNAFRAAH